MEVYAEAPAQRRGDQSRPRRRADQREFGQIEFHRTRRRTLPDHQIKLEILHRGIENLFNRRMKAMNLVNEEHVALFEISEQCRQIARLFYHGPGRGLIFAPISRAMTCPSVVFPKPGGPLSSV